MIKKPTKNHSTMPQSTLPSNGDLFTRVASIFEQARSNVVRSVNAYRLQILSRSGRELSDKTKLSSLGREMKPARRHLATD